MVGGLVGDPANMEFTAMLQNQAMLGGRPPKQSHPSTPGTTGG